MPSSESKRKKRKLSATSTSSSSVWAPSASRRRVSRIPGVSYSSISVASAGYDEDEDDSIEVRSEHDEDNSSTSENDDDDSESSAEQLALWRRDPKESFSDWTIEVTYEVDHADRDDEDGGIGEPQKVEDGSCCGGKEKKKGRNGDEPPDQKEVEAINEDGTKNNTNPSDVDSVETQTDTYHVHRCIIAAGARKSGYFARMFQNNWTESKSKKSVVKMDRLAAKFFPTMLDYIYYSQIVDSYDEDEDDEEEEKDDDKNSSRITLSPENVTALWWLAQYFEVPKLAREAKRFWQHDLGAMVKLVSGQMNITQEVFWSCCITYYEHARALQVEQAGLGILAVLSTHLVKIPENKIQLNFPDEGFWMSLMNTIIDNAGGTMSDNVSLHLSNIFGTHFKNCPMDPVVFRELTQSKYLPRIHREPAVLLLEMERGVATCLAWCESEYETKEEAERSSIGTQTSSADASDDGHEAEVFPGCRIKSIALGSGIITTQTMHKRTMVTDANGDRIVSDDKGELTCLQRRCIESMAQDWKTFDDIPDHDYCLLRNQSSSTLLHALLEFAKAAEKEIASLRDAIKCERHEFARFVRAPNSSVLDPNLGRRSKNDAVFPSDHIGDFSGWYIMKEDRLKYAMYYYDSERAYEDPSLGNPSLEIKEGSDESRFTEGQRLRAKLVANVCIDPETRFVRVPTDGLVGLRAELSQRRLISAHDDARDSAVLTGALSALVRVAKDHVKELHIELAEEKSQRKKFVRAQSYSDVSQGRAALLVSTPISFPPSESPSDGWCLRRGNRPYPLYYYKMEHSKPKDASSK